MSDNEKVDIGELSGSLVSQSLRLTVDESLKKDKECILVDRSRFDRQQETIEDLKKKTSIRPENILIPIATTGLGAFLSSLLSIPSLGDWRWWIFIIVIPSVSVGFLLASLSICLSRNYVTKERLKDVERMAHESAKEDE